jgi:hypothetical protein
LWSSSSDGGGPGTVDEWCRVVERDPRFVAPRQPQHVANALLVELVV